MEFKYRVVYRTYCLGLGVEGWVVWGIPMVFGDYEARIKVFPEKCLDWVGPWDIQYFPYWL